MPKTCWAPGCVSDYRSSLNSGSKRHFFSVPANKCADWNRRIPRDGVLSAKHYLCDLHFEEHFLVKADILNIGGKAESFPRLRWSLTDDAIPTLFPNIPKYLSKRIVVRPPRKQTFVDDDRNAANVSSFECKLELDDTSVLETGQCPTEFECKSEIAIDHSYASTRCKNLSSCQLELLRLRKKYEDKLSEFLSCIKLFRSLGKRTSHYTQSWTNSADYLRELTRLFRIDP